MILLGQCKRPEEREFYVRLAIRECWSRRGGLVAPMGGNGKHVEVDETVIGL